MQSSSPVLRQYTSRTTSILRTRAQTSFRPIHQARFFRTPLRSNNPARPTPSLFQTIRSNLFRRLRQTRHQSNNARPSPDPTPNLGSPEPSLSLSQRMKKLSREYGWSALGVYLGLSALDFPFCFLAVRMLGTDRIGEWEHAIVGAFKNVAGRVMPGMFEKKEGAIAGDHSLPTSKEEEEKWSWGVNEAQEKARLSNATLWTQLALAYAIHKSFIFIRVPLTAAVTPKVVKTLRGWGWDIGKRKPKTGVSGIDKS